MICAVSVQGPGAQRRAFGFEQIGAIPVALIVTVGALRFHDGEKWAEVRAGEMLLINPGERHRYHADVATSAYLVFAGLPGVRSRTWTVRRR